MQRNEHSTVCFRCGLNCAPGRGRVTEFLGSPQVQHDICAARYEGTPTHYLFNPPQDMAMAETYAHTFKGVTDLYNVTRLNAMVSGEPPIMVDFPPQMLHEQAILNGIRREDVWAVAKIREAKGTLFDPLLIISNEANTEHHVIDGNHRMLFWAEQGVYTMPAHILPPHRVRGHVIRNIDVSMLEAFSA